MEHHRRVLIGTITRWGHDALSSGIETERRSMLHRTLCAAATADAMTVQCG
jgi:hypothetical protein